MSVGEAQTTGWLISGFQAVVTVWAWSALVLLYGLYRSFGEAAQDAIRPSGPGA